MGLIDDLGPGRVGLDAAIFIYFIEASPIWLPAITPLFRAADTGARELVTSAVTLLEVLVVPYRANEALAARYEALLDTQPRGYPAGRSDARPVSPCGANARADRRSNAGRAALS